MSKAYPHPHAQPLLRDAGKVELLFLLFHGAGADCSQMQPLAEALVAAYPQAAVVSLDAPTPLPSEAVRGYQWFDDATVRAWMDYFELPWPRVALAGFSQGGLMALEAVQAQEQLAGRVLSFGAAPLARPVMAPEAVSLHLLHGLLDEEVPSRHVVDAARAWVDLEADVTADVLPGIGHELHPRLIERALHQLRSFIPARLWREAVLTAAEMEKADADVLRRGKHH